MNLLTDYVWEQKYRPENLDDVVLEQSIKNKLLEYKKDRQIPNILLNGIQGIGKTTLARVICKDVLNDCDYMYINASSENGIDVIRTKITDYANLASFDGGISVVILDEASGLTPQAQESLKSVMEEFSKTCRFILTCNEKHKITAPIISRCVTLDIKHSQNSVIKRIAKILESEGVSFDKEEVPNIKKIVDRYYPDIRKTIKKIQFFVNQEKIFKYYEDSEQISLDFIDKLFEMILKKVDDVFEIRQFIIDNEMEFSKDYHLLLKMMFENLKYMKDLKKEQKGIIAFLIPEYMYRFNSVVDKEINTFHCILDIRKELKID
jgi:DNA polymerase III delta prime subunit